MSKLLFFAVALALLSAFAPALAHAQMRRIDDAAQHVAEGLLLRIPAGSRIAVVSIQSGTAAMSDFIIDGIIDAFLDADGLTVVSRDAATLDLVQEELWFQTSMEVDDDTAQSLGRILGVRYIVTGALESRRRNILRGRFSGYYRLRVRVVEVETAAYVAAAFSYVRADRLVASLLDVPPVDGRAPVAAAPPPPTPPQQAPSAPPDRTASMLDDPARYWSLDLSGSFSLTDLPDDIFTGGLTVSGTLAPVRHSFLRLGADFLFGGNDDAPEGDFSSFTFFPFAQYALFLPFPAGQEGWSPGGWFLAAGMGVAFSTFSVGELIVSGRTPALDFTTGIMLGIISLSYSIRSDLSFSSFSDKLSVGLVFRFGGMGMLR